MNLLYHLAGLLLLTLAAVPAPVVGQRAPNLAPCTRTAPATPHVPGLASAARTLTTQPEALAQQHRARIAQRDRAHYARTAAAARQAACSPASARGEQLFLTSATYQLYESEEWANAGLSLYEYADNDSLAAFEYQVWVENAWQYDWRETWTYDEENRVTEHALRSIFFGVENGWRERFTFDATTGRLSESLYQILDGGNWFDDGWYVYTYNEAGLVETIESHLYDGTAWVPAFEESFTYDEEGRPATTESRYYDGLANAWVPLNRLTWTREADTEAQLGERWEEGAWQNEFLDTYTLNDSDRPTLFLGQVWEAGAWENRLRITFDYVNASSPLVSEVEVRWWGGAGEEGGLGDVWADGWRELLTYENDRLVDYIYLTGVGETEWNNTFRELSTYQDGRLALQVEQTGAGAEGWTNQFQDSFFYDNATGELSERTGYAWIGEAWTFSDRSLLAYGTATATEDDARSTPLGLDVYPNPATTFTVAIDLDRARHVSIDVVDVLGRRVAHLLNDSAPAGSKRLAWRPDGLAAGVYIVRVRADDHVIVRPVTVLR